MPSLIFFAFADTESMMDLPPDAFANAVGYTRSNAGRLFKNGAEYSVVKKLQVIEKLNFLTERDRQLGRLPQRLMSASALPKRSLTRCWCMETYWTQKSEKEGQIYTWSKTCGFFDELVLLALQEQGPQRTVASYKTTLMEITGASVTKSTISYWFKNRFDFKGSLRTTKVVPREKYRPANIIHFLTVTPPSGFRRQ